MTKLKLDLVCQVAVVVPDLEKGLEQVRTLFGIDESSVSFGESLELIRSGRLEPQIYNGVRGEYAYHQVNFFMGGMDIEMFAPVEGSTGDPISDFLKEHGPGIHHLNIRLANREEGLRFLEEALKKVPLLEGHFLGRHFAYFDMRKELGITFEVGSRVVGPRASMAQAEITALLQ
uniref:VOC family protein n=1 Tax=Dysosmobacter welbionis TaxID=2093857 RepID=UPI003FF00A2E